MNQNILDTFKQKEFNHINDLENYLREISEIQEEPKIFKLNKEQFKEYEYFINYLKIFVKSSNLIFSGLDNFLTNEKLEKGGIFNSILIITDKFYDFNEYEYYFEYSDFEPNETFSKNLINTLDVLIKLQEIKTSKIEGIIKSTINKIVTVEGEDDEAFAKFLDENSEIMNEASMIEEILTQQKSIIVGLSNFKQKLEDFQHSLNTKVFAVDNTN